MDLLDVRLFGTVFVSIFVAELGDKTQLATLLYASQAEHPRLTVFLAAASALVLASAIGVLAGGWLSQDRSERAPKGVAGARVPPIRAPVLWGGD